MLLQQENKQQLGDVMDESRVASNAQGCRIYWADLFIYVVNSAA